MRCGCPNHANLSDAMSSLAARLSARVGAAFEAGGLPASLGAVAPSNRPDLGQFQCNGALAAAKQAKKPPRQIAEAVVAELRNDTIFADLSLAGPGFINLDHDRRVAGRRKSTGLPATRGLAYRR